MLNKLLLVMQMVNSDLIEKPKYYVSSTWVLQKHDSWWLASDSISFKVYCTRRLYLLWVFTDKFRRRCSITCKIAYLNMTRSKYGDFGSCLWEWKLADVRACFLFWELNLQDKGKTLMETSTSACIYLFTGAILVCYCLFDGLCLVTVRLGFRRLPRH